jgi:hypothetical protein
MTQPRQVVFFIDRALESKRLLQALKESGAIIERHSDHKNNTVSGKLSALALRGKRARQFIALNLSAN